MKSNRKKYSTFQKVSIVRELLEGGYSLSERSEKYHIHPTQLTRWKKHLFEGAHKIFDQKNVKTEQTHEKEVE